MANDVFADTSGFFALLVKRDPMHGRARRILQRAAKDQTPFVTTDYILDETATLLNARGIGHLTETFFETVLHSTACRVEWMDVESFDRTRIFFGKHRGQGWSFTDCFSFVVMKELRIAKAMTADAHFRAAGFEPLLIATA